jgi:hypothetical protein
MEIKDDLIDFKFEKGKCDICSLQEFKYKCPSCLKKSCSLNCVNSHKKRYNCDGKRPRFSRKGLKQFEEKDLYKDLRFMTEMYNDTNRTTKKLFELSDAENKRLKEKKQKNFRKLCKKFRNVNLELCPTVLTRFNENKSFCDSKQKKFFWTVKFIFIKDEETVLHLVDSEPFDDSLFKIHQIFSSTVDKKTNLNLDLVMFLQDKLLNDYLTLVKINDKIPCNNETLTIYNNKYEIIDKTLLLKDFLFGRTVYEFPEFYIKLNNVNQIKI